MAKLIYMKPSDSQQTIESLLSHPMEYWTKQIYQRFPDPKLLLHSRQPVVVFGAGRMGRSFVETLKKHGIPVEAIIDNNPSLGGKTLFGVSIVSLKQAAKIFQSSLVLVASLLYETEICRELAEAKFRLVYPLRFLNFWKPDWFVSPESEGIFRALFVKKNIRDILGLYPQLADENSRRVLSRLIRYRLILDKSYITDIRTKTTIFSVGGIMSLLPTETYVDAGAFDGDTVKSFVAAVKEKFTRIYAFEPDLINYRKLKKTIMDLDKPNISARKIGLGKKPGAVSFERRGAVDSRIVSKNASRNSMTIHLTSLDAFFARRPAPTLIKMDIEGAELEALEGAVNIIKHHKPKLIISSYHASCDLWRIPLMIHRINPTYKIYLRHFTDEIVDTMCYAI